MSDAFLKAIVVKWGSTERFSFWECSMSVVWGTPYQARDEQHAAEILKTLTRFEQQLPRNFKPGRFPTPREMRAALDKLPGGRVNYNITTANWQAFVSIVRLIFWRQSVMVSNVGFGKSWSQDAPTEFYFEGDQALTGMILKALTPVCGAFILNNDVDTDDITIILPDAP
jgi:hypothetical protein